MLVMATLVCNYKFGGSLPGVEQGDYFGGLDDDIWLYRTRNGFNIVVNDIDDCHSDISLSLRFLVDTFGFDSVRGLRLESVKHKNFVKEPPLSVSDTYMQVLTHLE